MYSILFSKINIKSGYYLVSFEENHEFQPRLAPGPLTLPKYDKRRLNCRTVLLRIRDFWQNA